jgi:hypothetical protein
MIDARRFKEFLNHTLEYEAMLKKEIRDEYDKVVKATEEWDKRRNYDTLRSQFEQDRLNHRTDVEQWKKERDKTNSDLQVWHT